MLQRVLPTAAELAKDTCASDVGAYLIGQWHAASQLRRVFISEALNKTSVRAAESPPPSNLRARQFLQQKHSPIAALADSQYVCTCSDKIEQVVRQREAHHLAATADEAARCAQPPAPLAAHSQTLATPADARPPPPAGARFPSPAGARYRGPACCRRLRRRCCCCCCCCSIWSGGSSSGGSSWA